MVSIDIRWEDGTVSKFRHVTLTAAHNIERALAQYDIRRVHPECD